jgi:hypothetical protein
MSTTTTQSGRLRNIATPNDYIVFDTNGLDEVSFVALQQSGTNTGLVLTVQVEIGGGVWSAVPSGAVTVPITGVATDGVPVTTPRMRVAITTVGSSGVYDVYMHGRAAV